MWEVLVGREGVVAQRREGRERSGRGRTVVEGTGEGREAGFYQSRGWVAEVAVRGAHVRVCVRDGGRRSQADPERRDGGDGKVLRLEVSSRERRAGEGRAIL